MKESFVIKKDINLLPRKIGPSPFVRYGIPAVFLLFFLGAALAAGIIIPERIKSDRIAQKSALGAEVLALAGVQKEYDQLSVQVKEYKNLFAGFDSFTANKKGMAAMLDLIEKSCPTGVKITEVSFDYDKAVLAGSGQSDAEIASFVVNLRATEVFALTQIEMVNYNDRTTAGTTVAGGPRAFNVLLYYPIDTSSSSSQKAAPSQKQGGIK